MAAQKGFALGSRIYEQSTILYLGEEVAFDGQGASQKKILQGRVLKRLVKKNQL
jgi:hypothetical protein